MNVNPKYQQGQVQAPNLQAQQILLQQLQQGQAQQQPASNAIAGGGQFGQQAESFTENVGQQSLYQSNYQRPQGPVQQFFPQQFQQQALQQASVLQLQYQQPQMQQQYQLQLQGQQLQLQSQPQPQLIPHQPPSVQGQPFFSQQSLSHQQLQPQSQLQQQSQLFGSIKIENPNSIYWQHQIQLCQISRSINIPHYYARQFASNSRKNKNIYSESKAISLIDTTKSLVASLEDHEKSSVSTPNHNSALLHNKKMANDDEQEEQRMRLKTQGKQLWCQLDMSGQGLVNLSIKLFQYDFLESLFLNNNKLTVIPPIISKLKGLRTLDLSHNRISEVPAELGLCYNLKYLYLFDNNIKTLPNEFGNLIELVFLGIEGNPIEPNIANLVAEKGTKKLISYLRDLKPQRVPNPRPWLMLEDDGEISTSGDDSDSNTFTLVSYNTLCQHYATSKLYKYTPSWALDWDYRRNLLKEEILKYDNDVICMQEVETKTYHEFWVPIMAEKGYKGVFYSKTRSKTMSDNDAKKVDGCATFFKTKKFTLIQKQNFEYNSVCMGSDKYKKTKDLFNRFMNKDNIALITFFQHNESGEKIVIVNTHLHWDPALNDVKAVQVGILLEELQNIMKKFHGTNQLEDIKTSSLIICGDFNSVRESAVYQLFANGLVTKHGDLNGRDYGRFTDEGFRHNFKLKSAYENIGELPFTNCTPDFTELIDYIWYSTPTLRVKGLLGKIDEEYCRHCIGFPNASFPSDHIPLVTKFQIKKGGAAKRPDFKPDFKTGSSRKT